MKYREFDKRMRRQQKAINFLLILTFVILCIGIFALPFCKADEITEKHFIITAHGLVEVNTDPNCIDLGAETVCVETGKQVPYKRVDEPLEFTNKDHSKDD